MTIVPLVCLCEMGRAVDCHPAARLSAPKVRRRIIP